MADRVVNTITRWKVDTPSITAAVNANKRVEQSLAAVEKQEAALAAQSRAMANAPTGMEQIIAAAKRGEIEVDALRDTLRSLGQQDAEIDKIAVSLDKAGREAKTLRDNAAQIRFDEVSRGVALAGDAQSNLGAIRGLADIAGLGGVGSGLGAVGEIVALGEELPRLKAALQGLPDVAKAAYDAIGARGTALIGSLALLAVVAKVASDASQRGYEQTKIATDNQRLYFELLQAGTSEAIAAKRQEVELSVQLNEQLVNYYRQVLTQAGIDIREQFGLLAPLVQVGEALGAGSGITKGYIDAATEANNQLTLARGQLEVFNRVLGTTEIATNDAAEAERKLAEARQQTQLSDAENAIAIQALTKQQRDERIAAQENEIRFIGEYIRTHNLSAETVQTLSERQIDLYISTNQLKEVTDSYADTLERVATASQALSDSTDAYLEAVEWEVDARQKMAEITAEINRIETERIAKLTELAAELSRNQTELWRKAGEDVLAAEGKAQEAREKQQEQHWKRVKEINDRAFAAQSNAIAARDVLAYYLSRKQQAEDLKREEEANEDRLKQIDDALEDQKDVIAKRLKEQLVTLEANYRKQVDATNDAARKATDIQRAAYREQEVALQNAIMAQRNITLAAQQIRSGDELRHQTLLTAIVANGAQYIETLWLNLMNGLIAGMPAGGGSQFPPLIIGGGPGGGGGPLPTPYTPGVAGGGLPSPQAAARNSGGVNIALTVHGVSEEAVIREVTSNIREAYRRLG